MFLVGLYAVSSGSLQHLKADHDLLIYEAGIRYRRTYKWQAAVCAPADLGLISVDKDPGVPQRAASSVARYGAVMCPADGLLVDELNGGIWTRLYTTTLANVLVLYFIVMPLPSAFPPVFHPPEMIQHTWSSIMLCSNRGPLIAISLGF